MNIKLRVVNPCNSKLKFIKELKTATGLGLKESKDIVDWLHDNQSKDMTVPFISYESLKIFKDEVEHFGGLVLINGGLEWNRNIKMLELGIGEKEEYVDTISEYLFSNNDLNLLSSILSKLNKEQLIETIKDIKI
jgi:DNA-binding transcriptional MerR regulator